MPINIQKKVVAYPAHGKLNDKIIIEDVSTQESLSKIVQINSNFCLISVDLFTTATSIDTAWPVFNFPH